MKASEDIVKHILSLVAEVAPSFSEQDAEKVEKQIRQAWGGERPFIAKRAHDLRAAREKVMKEVGTKPDKQLAQENGITRRTLYRWLNKESKQNG